MTSNNNLKLGTIITILVTVSLLVFVSPVLASEDTDPVTYQVQAGDSLWLIGQRFGTTATEIMTLNNLVSSEIYPGQVLKIPTSLKQPAQPEKNVSASVNYVVNPGDSLFIISQKFGVTITALVEANKLTGTTIFVGQVLVIPVPYQQTYIVQSGDTLFLLAKKFGTTIDNLISINKLSSTTLRVGQVLLVPGQNNQPPSGDTGVGQPPAEQPSGSDNGSQQPSGNDNGTQEPPASGEGPAIPYGGQWGVTPPGLALHWVQTGENLWVIAKKYNTTIAAIMTTNHLHTDLVMLDQPLFIPQNSAQPVTVPSPFASMKEGYGELLDWKYVSWILDTGNIATLKDLDTGKTFKVRRLGGSNHADMEPLTAADTAVMKQVFGGQWSWNRRAVLVFVDGKVIAGSMAGMPHSIETITDNGFPGHFDLHFLNSRTHNTNTIDTEHQKMVQKAAGN